MLDAVSDDPAKYVTFGPFWEAGALGLKALSVFIKRYGEEAKRLAADTNDMQRKAESE